MSTSSREQSNLRFGENLRRLRQDRQITLEELANQLGYADHSFLSRLERGKKGPSVTLVVMLAKILGVSTDELLLGKKNIF